MNFQILPIYYFFGIKIVRVGGKILGSIGNTHIFFFGLKHTAVRSESKYLLAQNQDNVSKVEQHVYAWTVVSEN